MLSRKAEAAYDREFYIVGMIFATILFFIY